MGYELEIEAGAALPDAGGEAVGVRVEDRHLEARWQRSNDRLAAALAHYRSLRGRANSAKPAWQAAQLRVAEARQRQQELYDEIVHFESARDATSRDY